MAEKKNNYLLIFLKGLLMGIADVVPGVSGGTIAFITGIYDNFVHGLSKIGTFAKDLIKIFTKNGWSKVLKSFKKNVDYPFFIPLLLGTTVAFIIGSKFIPPLISQYPAYVFSFFVGLILASAYVVYKDIEEHKLSGWLIGLVGLLIGFAIAILPTAGNGETPSILFVTLIGAISIIAMVMPGISGSYIVLMFGQYTFLLSIVHDLANLWHYFVAFTVGGIIGILLFSKLLSFLLKKYHAWTMFALTGIMLGAVYRPVNDAIVNLHSSRDIIFSGVLVLVGILLVIYLNSFKKKK